MMLSWLLIGKKNMVNRILIDTNVLLDYLLTRKPFYEEAKKAYAIIATSEKALYANIMLQKGVVVE